VSYKEFPTVQKAVLKTAGVMQINSEVQKTVHKTRVMKTSPDSAEDSSQDQSYENKS
jgi:hypothetical protein